MNVMTRKKKSNGKGPILIIEDTPNEGIGLQKDLEEYGYKVKWVPDEVHALEEIESQVRYKAIIADVHLGPMENALGATIKARSWQPWSLIVCISGVQNSDLIEEAKKHCDYYSDKPIDIEDLIDKIEKEFTRLIRINELVKDRGGMRKETSKESTLKTDDININSYKIDMEDLMTEHEGEYVAYLDGQQVGIGKDKNALVQHIYEDFDRTGVLIVKVGKERKLYRNISPRRKSDKRG